MKRLKVEIMELNLEEVVSKDEEVNYFTGIPTWEVLYFLLQFIRPHLKESLPPFSSFLLHLLGCSLDLLVKT